MLDGKRLYSTPTIKYIGAKIDENLNWHHHINHLAAKLKWKNFPLIYHQKLYQSGNTSIYFSIFNSGLNYGNLIWARNSNVIQRIIILQK